MIFLRHLLTNHPLANIAFLVVLVLGFLSYLGMPREQDPEINFNWVNITTVLPGASAEDVERLVTKPLEDGLARLTDLRFVSSNSRENVSTILVRFNDISERNFDKRMNDLRREVQNKTNSELPPEVKDPFVFEITTSNGFPTAMLLVTGTADDETLRATARAVKEDVERLKGVANVFASGLHDPELVVEFDATALALRGMTAADAADGVTAWFRDTMGGKAPAGQRDWMVRAVGTDVDPRYLSELELLAASRTKVRLGSVATVERKRERAEQLVRFNGQPAVLLAITKKAGTNTLDLVERLVGFIGERNGRIAGSGVQLVLADDQTIPTRNAIGIMESNAVLGLALVIATCWIFLGTRLSILVGLGIPFALAGTFWLLAALGYTVNISVLLGVVIALGMLVDDAVVVVEAIYFRATRGAAVLDAAVDGLREVFAPVTSSVATTVAAFLPLMLLPGIVGKFMFVIPFVVTAALLISLVEAYWMLPAHAIAWFDPSRTRRTGGLDARVTEWRRRFLHRLRLRYAGALVHVMRYACGYVLAVIAALIAAGALIGFGALRFELFAFDPLRIFYVNVDLPAGTPLERTMERTLAVEAIVKRHLQAGEARSVTSAAGVKYTDTEPLYGDQYGQITVSLNPRRGEMRDTTEVAAAMRTEIEDLAGDSRNSILLLAGGPPASKPIKVKVRGDDYVMLRRAADAVIAAVRAIDGSRDVTDDDVPGRPELVLRLDREAVNNAGLHPGTVARLIRLHVDGEIASSLRAGGEKIEVRLRAKRERSAGVDALLNDPIALPGGGATTLGALVESSTGEGKSVIRHYNFRRVITVEADLDKKQIDTVAANNKIKAAWSKIAGNYPGIDLDFSGELDDINESLDAMLVLFLFGLGLIYLILAAQFRSYWQPLMILVTVPLAFIGVTFGLFVSNNPISLYTLYGVVALTGIAVNSAIVLIDAANERRSGGMSALHAAVYAARRRVVPVIITSTTTVAGLFSLAFGIGGKSLIWGPVAASIVWGLTFSTILTLFVIPLLYRVFMRR